MSVRLGEDAVLALERAKEAGRTPSQAVQEALAAYWLKTSGDLQSASHSPPAIAALVSRLSPPPDPLTKDPRIENKKAAQVSKCGPHC